MHVMTTQFFIVSFLSPKIGIAIFSGKDNQDMGHTTSLSLAFTFFKESNELCKKKDRFLNSPIFVRI